MIDTLAFTGSLPRATVSDSTGSLLGKLIATFREAWKPFDCHRRHSKGHWLDSCFRLLRHAEMKLGQLFEGFPWLEHRFREGGLVRRIGIMLSFQAECFVHFVVGVARISR